MLKEWFFLGEVWWGATLYCVYCTSLRGQLSQVRVWGWCLRQQIFWRSKPEPGGQTRHLRRAEDIKHCLAIYYYCCASEVWKMKSHKGFLCLCSSMQCLREQLQNKSYNVSSLGSLYSSYCIASAKPSVRCGTTRVGVLGTILSSSSKKCCCNTQNTLFHMFTLYAPLLTFIYEPV